jgi:hypothetical protein
MQEAFDANLSPSFHQVLQPSDFSRKNGRILCVEQWLPEMNTIEPALYAPSGRLLPESLVCASMTGFQ